jgi:hypothetical protein
MRMVTAHASVTISWNTKQPAAAPAPPNTKLAGPVQSGVVLGVHGTHVVLRMQDGTTRLFVAPPRQAKILHGLVGSAIQFRNRP